MLWSNSCLLLGHGRGSLWLLSGGRLDFTIGSALDLFGGKIPYEKMRMFCD